MKSQRFCARSASSLLPFYFCLLPSSWSGLLPPLAREHRVRNQVFEVVVHPLGLSVPALLCKAEAFGDASAAQVLDGAVNLDAVQAQLREGVSDKHAASLRHDAAPLQVCGEPVADVGLAIRPVKVVVADAARDAFAEEDERGEALVFGGLAEVAADELARILDRVTLGRPGHPLLQVREVAADERRQLFGVALVNGPQFEFVFDSVGEHLRRLVVAGSPARRRAAPVRAVPQSSPAVEVCTD